MRTTLGTVVVCCFVASWWNQLRLNCFMATFVKTILFTDVDWLARFKEETIPFDEGNPGSRLSALSPSGGYQLRHSPVGFRSQFHCTTNPQWVFILSGRMRIGLQDGSSRDFEAGQHFFSADLLPDGATFDDQVHGHFSCQVGDEPLVTLCALHEYAAFGLICLVCRRWTLSDAPELV
jgi:hypothetical protein